MGQRDVKKVGVRSSFFVDELWVTCRMISFGPGGSMVEM